MVKQGYFDLVIEIAGVVNHFQNFGFLPFQKEAWLQVKIEGVNIEIKYLITWFV